MTLPGCTALCPLNKFINLTKDVIPEDWDRECLVSWNDISSRDIIGNCEVICFRYYIVLLIRINC